MATDDELIAHLEKQDRQMRRDVKAYWLRVARYVLRTPLKQQMADSQEYNRQVLAKGWITRADEMRG